MVPQDLAWKREREREKVKKSTLDKKTEKNLKISRIQNKRIFLKKIRA